MSHFDCEAYKLAQGCSKLADITVQILLIKLSHCTASLRAETEAEHPRCDGMGSNAAFTHLPRPLPSCCMLHTNPGCPCMATWTVPKPYQIPRSLRARRQSWVGVRPRQCASQRPSRWGKFTSLDPCLNKFKSKVCQLNKRLLA